MVFLLNAALPNPMDDGSLAKVGRVGKEEAWWYFTLFAGISSHLALYVHCHRVGELEGVEESVGDDGCPRVRAGNLHELADHLRT